MGTVAIQATFGKDQKAFNGLESIVEDLLEKPLQEHYVIAKVRTAYTKTDYDNGGVETPTVKFVHIEPMLSDKEETAARKLFEQACKARLGELPQQTLFEDAKGGGPDDERDNG